MYFLIFCVKETVPASAVGPADPAEAGLVSLRKTEENLLNENCLFISSLFGLEMVVVWAFKCDGL